MIGRQKLSLGRGLLLLLAAAWLIAFVLVPILIVVRISLSDTAAAAPPYTPVFTGFDALADFISSLDFENYARIFSDSLYLDSYLTSLRLALLTTLLTFLIGYPLALAISRAPSKAKTLLLTAVIIPFWTSFLIRVYAWIGILKDDGFLNQLLQATGIINTPLQLLNTNTAVLIGMAYSYLPFMVLPVYAALEKLDPQLLEAAADLGCAPWRRFWRITLPLTMPGVIAGAALVFIPAVGEFVIPDLLGGSDTLMIGHTLWVDFFSNRDWPIASAAAIVMLVTIILPFVLLQKRTAAVRAR